MLRALPILIGLLACAGAMRPALAGTILQPTSVISQAPMGEFNTSFKAANLRDQSGLSAGYTSLVDDFDAYIASAPTHTTASGNSWFSSVNNTTGNLDFSLGGLYTIESLALWNFGGNHPSNIVGFTIFADDNAAFSSPTNLGSFNANPNTGPLSAVLPQVFSFAATSASHFRLQITSNNGTSRTGAGEVAFEVAAVPEPSAWWLAVAGAALVALVFRRKKGFGLGRNC